MSRNIYDIFNSRKEGLDILAEGLSYENVEAYESLDVAMGELETIVKESTNEMIELQAAAYLEDLVLENMMFDDFDEEKISVTIEATMKERAGGLVNSIKQQWEKIKAWFAATAKAIANYFVAGEKLVNENKAIIPEAMKKCEARVKMFDYNMPKAAMDKCTSMVIAVRAAGAYLTDEQSVLSAAGKAKSRSDVARVVKEAFGMNQTSEKPIKNIDPNLAMAYAGKKSDLLDTINKQKANFDKEFSAMLQELKDDKNEESAKQAKLFNFAIGIKSAIINAEVACTKKAAGDMAAVIRKAVTSNGGGVKGAVKAGNAAYKNAKYEPKKESFMANLEGMMEELEFVDDEY